MKFGNKQTFFVVSALIIFLAVSVFGTFIMVRDAGREGCFASRASGNSCPLTTQFIAYANFHLNAAKVFSTGIFIVFALLAAFMFAEIVVAIGPPGTYAPVCVNSLARASSLAHFNRLIRWYSLKENAPNGA